jgi:hypothetical protein
VKTDHFFRISVIDGALAIVRYSQQRLGTDIDDAVRYFRLGPSHHASLDYNSAIELAATVGWDAFIPDGDRRTELAASLFRLAVRGRPLWAQVSPQGRRSVVRVANVDQLQCLRFAGLLDTPPSEETIAWWDQLALHFRSASAQQLLDTGREGERRSLEYEQARLAALGITDRQPVWVSVEDNTVGYDIDSFDLNDSGDVIPLRIEAKASSSSTPRYFLSRHEWDVASRAPCPHVVHVWTLQDGRLRIYTPNELARHIPSDGERGRWSEVELRLPADDDHLVFTEPRPA